MKWSLTSFLDYHKMWSFGAPLRIPFHAFTKLDAVFSTKTSQLDEINLFKFYTWTFKESKDLWRIISPTLKHPITSPKARKFVFPSILSASGENIYTADLIFFTWAMVTSGFCPRPFVEAICLRSVNATTCLVKLCKSLWLASIGTLNFSLWIACVAADLLDSQRKKETRTLTFMFAVEDRILISFSMLQR